MALGIILLMTIEKKQMPFTEGWQHADFKSIKQLIGHPPTFSSFQFQNQEAYQKVLNSFQFLSHQ